MSQEIWPTSDDLSYVLLQRAIKANLLRTPVLKLRKITRFLLALSRHPWQR